MCEIDWEIFSGIITSLSALVVTFFAYKGINTWKDEAKWNRKNQIIEKVLVLFYEAENKIKEMRSPSKPNLNKIRIGELNEDGISVTEEYYNAIATLKIYNKNKTIFDDIEKNRQIFKAVTRKADYIKPFTDILILTQEIIDNCNYIKKFFGFKEFNNDKYYRVIREFKDDEKDLIQERLDEIMKDINIITQKLLNY